MLDFNEISIQDKDLFDNYLSLWNNDISELTFTNFFMWRKRNGFRYTVKNNCLIVIAVPKEDEPYCFYPFGKSQEMDILETLQEVQAAFAHNNWKLKFAKLTKEQARKIEESNLTNFEIIPDRNNWDYVYKVSNLTELRGKKFDGKRNHINKFLKSYEYEIVELSLEHIQDCRRINAEWCRWMGCEQNHALYCEKVANEELLENYTRLGCKGILIKVGGKFEGYTVGEKLNDTMAVVHIEKANHEIHGLYQILNQQFCKRVLHEFDFVNREQDLGMEGLKKAKESYHPDRMIEKYILKVVD